MAEVMSCGLGRDPGHRLREQAPGRKGGREWKIRACGQRVGGGSVGCL